METWQQITDEEFSKLCAEQDRELTNDDRKAFDQYRVKRLLPAASTQWCLRAKQPRSEITAMRLPRGRFLVQLMGFATAMTILLSVVGACQAPDSWVGKRVITKSGTVLLSKPESAGRRPGRSEQRPRRDGARRPKVLGIPRGRGHRPVAAIGRREGGGTRLGERRPRGPSRPGPRTS